jgi:dCMP deaminase
MTRISRDEWGLRLAEVVAFRATCLRRSVGCVLMDADGYILSTGHNGRASGLPHCNSEDFLTSTEVIYPYACAGATAPSGTSLDACEAVHAEANALLRVRDVREIHTAYVTVSPCVSCVKLLLNTGCQRVVFREPYAHDEAAHKLWGRDWNHVPAIK